MRVFACILTIFLASSFLVVDVILVQTQLGNLLRKAIALNSVNKTEQDQIVRLHESYRAQVKSTDMMKLRYHPGIAVKAQALANTCVFEHDTEDDRAVAELPGVYIGQNLCEGHSSWRDCINDWASEKLNFQYGVGSKNGGEIGHYTQMMLWNTAAIGCGFNECDGSPIYVCNYAYGQYSDDLITPWKSGKQCADCPKNCSNKLFCDCGGKFCSNEDQIMSPSCVCKYWWTI
ncbi:hypothetical protein ACJMK2_026303 [Sinanodonta woodiana]|uniref:SCP domain-containing protein n=1 Tax=Sinanodonta woodiana TaxID=1069815 RepID=A0ABD3XMP9_SINWO